MKSTIDKCITYEFSKYVYEIKKRNNIDEETMKLLKLSFMDWLGVSIAGSKEEIAEKLYKIADVEGGNPQSTLIGAKRKGSVLTAALINGSLAHSQDFDDVHERLQLHLTGSIISSSLSTAQYVGCDGETMLKAILAGIQVTGALGEGLLPQHHQQGWHSTSTLGVFGSAAAASVILGLNIDQICNSFGIASTCAAGLHANFGTMSKPLQSGNAARAGVMSAILAKENFTGSRDILDHGYLEIVSPVVYEDKIINSLNGHFVVEDIRFKEFPCGAPSHAAILSSFKIRESLIINSDQIEKVLVRVYPRAVKLAGNSMPKDGLEAKFSIPYCTLTALLKGEVGLEAFTDEAVKDNEIQRALPKVILEPEPEFEATRGASVKVFFKDGRTSYAQSPLFSGEINREKQEEAVLLKFRTLVNKYGMQGKCEELEELIYKMENLKNINTIDGKI